MTEHPKFIDASICDFDGVQTLVVAVKTGPNWDDVEQVAFQASGFLQACKLMDTFTISNVAGNDAAKAVSEG